MKINVNKLSKQNKKFLSIGIGIDGIGGFRPIPESTKIFEPIPIPGIGIVQSLF